MTSSEFIKLCQECEEMLRAAAPYDTGNLRYHAIKIEFPDANTCRLYVDEKIAPYMKYTNEPWDQKLISMGNFRKGETVTRLRTWRNPNQGWWERAVQQIAEHVAQRVKGELNHDSGNADR